MSSRINQRKKRGKIRTIINDTASKHTIQRISQSKKRRVCLKKREREGNHYQEHKKKISTNLQIFKEKQNIING